MNFKLKFRNNPNHHGPAFLCFVPFLQRLAVGEVSGSKPRSRDTHSIIQMFSIQAVPQLGLGKIHVRESPLVFHRAQWHACYQRPQIAKL